MTHRGTNMLTNDGDTTSITATQPVTLNSGTITHA